MSLLTSLVLLLSMVGEVALYLDGYSPEDIWNQYRAIPEKSLEEKKKQCHGGKKAKQRLTISFIVNAAGEKEVPVVIGKAAKPRCFKGLNDVAKPLGITYYSNPKSWMTSEIMEDMLSKFNRKMSREGRNVLLLIDNVPSLEKFSNIKMVFLPKNTTSRLQPLDAGIIKNFKVHYGRCLIRHVLASINDKNSLKASDIAKSVDVLLAIRWIKQSWDVVKCETVMNCFKHCGIVAAVNPGNEPL